jgi:tRNA pseudouridine38-40 synthase
MVRNIVGTLVWIGRGNESATWIPTVIQAKNRREAGMTAPAKGLTLVQVWYDEDPDSDDQVSMPVQS